MRVLIPLAEGFEEMEAVIMVDILRRANITVLTAAMGDDLTVTASRGVRLIADSNWETIQADTFDMIALPGGMGGTRKLQTDERLLQALRNANEAKRQIAAICAAPLVLQTAGILEGRKVTCHPGVASELIATTRSDERVVTDGNLTTSQGPGTSYEFALELVKRLASRQIANQIAAGLVL